MAGGHQLISGFLSSTILLLPLQLLLLLWLICDWNYRTHLSYRLHTYTIDRTLHLLAGIALILGDVGEYERAEERLRVAIEGYKRIIGGEHRHTLKSRYGLTLLCWACEVAISPSCCFLGGPVGLFVSWDSCMGRYPSDFYFLAIWLEVLELLRDFS